MGAMGTPTEQRDGFFVQRVKLRAPSPSPPPPDPQLVAKAVPVRLELADLDLGTAQDEETHDPLDVGFPAGTNNAPEPASVSTTGDASGTTAGVSVEPDDQKLQVADEVAVYQGSLYAWCLLWVFMISGFTQAVKRLAHFPLVEREPLTIWKFTIGGWSDRGFAWLVKCQPFVWAIPTTLYFGPRALDAMGFAFTPIQSLGFVPIVAVASMGVWQITPRPIKDWLNGGAKGDEGRERLHTEVADLRGTIAELLEALRHAQSQISTTDPDLAEQLRSVTEEHSAVDGDEDEGE